MYMTASANSMRVHSKLTEMQTPSSKLLPPAGGPHCHLVRVQLRVACLQNTSPAVPADKTPNQFSRLFHTALLLLLLLMNRLVVIPLCAKLSSQDPAVAAAARSEAVAAALAASKSDLARELHLMIPVLLARLNAVVHQELKLESILLCGLDVDPTDAVRCTDCCSHGACHVLSGASGQALLVLFAGQLCMPCFSNCPLSRPSRLACLLLCLSSGPAMLALLLS